MVMTLQYTFEYGLAQNSPARMIREAVFMHEQGFKNEFDEQDNDSYHFVFYYEGQPFGCARLFNSPDKDNYMTLGRVAILKEYRGLHLGLAMMQSVEEEVKKMHKNGIELSAQVRVQPFYEKAGFMASGEVYLDEYCPHIHMEKAL